MRVMTAVVYVAICYGASLFGANKMLSEAFAKAHAAPIAFQQTYESSPDEGEDARIERHLDYTDHRLDDLEGKVSLFEGVGTGIMGCLGALQILGLVAQRKRDNK